MSSLPSTVYLVTGSNRGIGFGLVAHIVATHPNAFVYAGVRDVTKAFALQELSQKYAGRISIVKYVSGDADGNAQLAKEIQEKHGRLDTVIANAAVARIATTVLETPAKEFEEHLYVNAVGTAVLFQAVHDLLKASPSPRFVPISTGGASIGALSPAIPLRTAAYGSSKAALNYITRKIHFENEWLIAFPLAPGAVETDSAKEAIASDTTGIFAALLEKMSLLTPEAAAKALLGLIDGSTRDKDGGEFINVDGTKIPW